MISGLARLLSPALVAILAVGSLVASPAEAATRTATITVRPDGWTYASSPEINQSHWNEPGFAPVGLRGTFAEPDEPQAVDRSFFTHDLSALRGKTIVDARLTLIRPDPSCENRVRGFELWQTGSIDKDTDWKRQPEWVRNLDVVPGQWSCSVNSPYVLNATNAVADAAASGRATFGVRASFEDQSQGRLTFENNPELQITYEYDEQNPYPGGPGLPTKDLEPSGWAYAESGHRNVPHWNEDAPAPVGSPDEHRLNRSFFTFDLASLTGDKAIEAKLWVTRADTCRPGEQPVELWETDGITEETTWHRQPLWTKLLDTYIWGSCEDSGWTLVLNASEAVSAALAAGRTSITLGLRSSAEADPLGWYQFDKSPRLQVGYVPPLSPPAQLMTDDSRYGYPDGIGGMVPPKPCVSGEPRQWIPYAPRPEAVLTSGAGSVRARWQWETLDGLPVHEEVTGFYIGKAYGSRIGVNDQTYRWRVRFENAYEQVTDWSTWCEYGVDTGKPDRPATVVGDPYTGAGGVYVGGPGVTGTFTLGPNGVPDVTGYFYQLASGWTYVPAGPDGTATITWTPTAGGVYLLAVVSVDRAGNRALEARRHYFGVASAP